MFKITKNGLTLELNEIYDEALILFQNQKYEEAIEVCNKIVDIDGNHYHTWNLLGNIFLNLNDYENAKHFFITALNLKPDFIEAYYMLGNLLFKVEMYQDAINIWMEALKHDASHAVIHSNIAAAYIRIKEDEKAIEFAKKALEIDSRFEDAYLCLADIHKNKMQLHEMKDNLQKTLMINHMNVKANFDLSYIYFIEKEYEKAFKHFEFRKLLPNEEQKYNYMPYQEYNKEDLSDKSLLIYHEQGFGDNIQFARFLKDIPCQNISFGIQNSLNKLFSYNFPNINFKKEITSEEKFDFMIPSMSLPFNFKLYEIGNKKYLEVDNKDIEEFKKANLEKNKLNIGIVWSGSKTSLLKSQKSLELSDFEELFDDKKTFYSLQIEGNEELENMPNIINLGKDFKNFYDTAVAICSLDLIISVDTAVAHLTGALGQKGIILSNKKQFDWRWENENKKSLWYESLNVIKYEKIEDTIEQIKKEIDEL